LILLPGGFENISPGFEGASAGLDFISPQRMRYFGFQSDGGSQVNPQ
jgi:hypothetical protein